MTTPRAPRHPVYKAWWAMKYRCYQHHHPLYKHYGARGITVCARWLESYEAFKNDMLPTWKRGLSIERLDNEGNYGPSNCRWATVAAQARNRRNSRLIETPFSLMHVADAEDFFGFGRGVIAKRIANNWPQERWFESPRPRRTKAEMAAAE